MDRSEDVLGTGTDRPCSAAPLQSLLPTAKQTMHALAYTTALAKVQESAWDVGDGQGTG